MIINRTPYRISFLGGGTDYPSWYLEHDGSVLATTINPIANNMLKLETFVMIGRRPLLIAASFSIPSPCT
jgi:galactokinase/mevalonate kinase-like predicted kinase